MKNILKKRILDLGRGEDGVALVVTLAVFMFMYIFCAGVFAVGQMVKDRICLQNAADAAAYSAAVVQADTLSRIATINRAMSWTYAQMNKRRMDYIVYRWMEHSMQHYADDREEAAAWVRKSVGKKHYETYHTLHQGYHGYMELSGIQVNNGSSTVSGFFNKWHEETQNAQSTVEINISNKLSDYDNSHVNKERVRGSFYVTPAARRGIERLEQQIDADMESIYWMNKCEKYLIAGEPGKYIGMKERMDIAAREILRANVPDFDNCAYVVKADSGRGATGFLRPLENTAGNESLFLDWGNRDECADRGVSPYSLNDFFGPGAGTWFKPERTQNGFLWQYVGELRCSWSWNAWYCSGCNYTWVREPVGGGEYVRRKIYLDSPNYRYINGLSTGVPPCQHKTGVNTGNEYANCCVSQKGSGITCSVMGSVLRRYYDSRNRKKRRDGWILDGTYRYQQRKSDFEVNNSDRGGLPLRAQPLVVKRNFFGSDNSNLQDGTITVGVARPNMNPWRNQYVLGKEDSNIGLYHAFDPFLDWMVCFASARAGYKIWDDPPGYEQNRYNQRARVYRGERDYCIDWKKPQRVISGWVWVKNRRRHGMHLEPVWSWPDWRQSWNLRQSDWDAVMIPVCRAASGAEERTDYWRTYGDFREPCWGATDHYYLTKVLRNENWQGALGPTTDPYCAGSARPQAVQELGYVDYAPGDLRGLVDALPNQYQGWNANAVQRGGTTAIKWPFQWRVSGFGKSLNWFELQRQMLH